MISFATAMLVSVLSGLYTAMWGAYKDGPWEGFRLRTFPRSIHFSVGIASVLVASPGGIGRGFLELPRFVVFLMVMGIERIVSEIYKACFRTVDQRRFLIPQHLTAFGNPVRSMSARLLLGMIGLFAVVGVVSLRAPVEGPGGLLLVGVLTGLFICAGGAYKDAPFEGFSPPKFLRSALVLAPASLLLVPVAPLPLGFAICAVGGLERFVVEYYKSFLARSVPGKFRSDLPRIERPWLANRHLLKHGATALVLVLGSLYALALPGWV